MELKIDNDIVTMTLSRRNLETLLEQLDQGGPSWARRAIDGRVVIVVAEENDAHYERRQGALQT